MKWISQFDFLLSSAGGAVPRLSLVRPHGRDFHGDFPVKHRPNSLFFAVMYGKDGETPAGGTAERRRWRRAARVGAPFVALVVWAVLAVGLVVWAAAQ